MKELKPLARTNWHPEALAVGSVATYTWCSGGILESKALAAVTRAVGDKITTRNWATVMKIHAALEAESDDARPKARPRMESRARR
jgi:hypothetical protein